MFFQISAFYGLFMGEQSNTGGNYFVAAPLLFSFKEWQYKYSLVL